MGSEAASQPDEHDVEEAPIVDVGDGRMMVDASVSIADLSRYLGADLPEDGDYHTLAGFIVAELGTVPEPGATLRDFDHEAQQSLRPFSYWMAYRIQTINY